MKGFASSRAIIAGTQRVNARTVRNLLSHTAPGSGIAHQTTANEGYSEPVIEIHDEAHGLTGYLVESEKFAGRYYLLRQYEQSGAWRFSGDDKLKARYIGKVEAFRAEAAEQEIAEQAVEEVVEVVAAAPRRSAPCDIHSGSWNGGVSIFVSDAEIAEIRERVRAATPPAILAAQDKEDAFLRVWAEVEAIHHRWQRERGAWKVVA